MFSILSFLFTFTFTPLSVVFLFVTFDTLIIIKLSIMGDQLDELLASQAARCRVCFLSLHCCILFNAWLQIQYD